MNDAAPDLLTLAAGGDRMAQSVLAIEALDAGEEGLAHPLEAWTAAELWGRLAAAHGYVADTLGLAGLLFKRSLWERDNGRAPVPMSSS